MQHAVGRAAGRDDRGGGVLECLACDDVPRPHVSAHEVDCEASGLLGGLRLALGQRRDAVGAGRRETEELEDRRHRVGGELPSAGPGPGAGEVLNGLQLLVGDLARGVFADGLVDVLNGQVAITQVAGHDRAAVDQ